MAFVRSTRNGSFGITAVRAAFGTVDWFAPEFDLGGGVFGRWKNADVLFVAGRRAGAAAETLVWAVDPSSGAVLDSVVIGVRSIAAQGGVLGLVYAGPAGRVLVQRFGSVTSCPANLGSAASCTTVATVPESGRLSYQEGDSVVLLHDPGRRDGPGSGSVYAISLDATRVDSHPLPRVAGDAFVSQGVSALRGGTVWVVTGGTIPFFALFREQSPVVLLYDPLSRRVLKRIAVPSNEPVTITVPL